ncbi:M20/M25/M40 family metallo-hydrolase [Aquisalimonas asiatica]|uniref:Peptidase family M28 n=1 Tax=Aquisalimonas asiatica TaxID=406100 RepID=A0A1H8VNZ5_9GAMM|nr:M20/M25/M40 family metallo-hydrolase [Aquisalimonas asiatica]SEP17131.1 Peptidase family M28 [Aquisalimonas asiatica]
MTGWWRVVLLVVLVATVSTGAVLWSTWMPGESVRGPLAAPDGETSALASVLEADVRALAEEIGERNMHTDGSMAATVDWLEQRLGAMGVTPERHVYVLQGGRWAGERAVNVVAEVPGTRAADEVVIVGAHYDTVPGSPGANDNASGVAVLLALAAWTRENPQARTVRFIAFANEEQPFHQTRDMGSEAYVRDADETGDAIAAMMALDGLGYYSTEPGSQHYPYDWIRWFYPERGDFIGFVTRTRDANLVRQAVGAFRRDATIPSEGAALPAIVPGIGWSDHRPFWDAGHAAFLVTDTLPFRDPQYHRRGDTPERLDYDRLARVAIGLRGVVEALGTPDGE